MRRTSIALMVIVVGVLGLVATEASASTQRGAAIACVSTLGAHPNHPVLGLGSVGADVREAQCRLVVLSEKTGLDFYPGGIDGIYGQNTRQAVIRLQNLCRWLGRDIASDGIVGAQTWPILHAYDCFP